MLKQLLLASFAVTATLTLAACSDSNDETTAAPESSSQLNPDAEPPVDDGTSGGDTTDIAGLWDGTTTEDNVKDEVFWHLSENGVLTRYDYQQDDVATATRDNCYIIGNPISVSPEDDDGNYSFFNVAATVVKSDNTLTITFLDADINDLDDDDDTDEMPTLSWTSVTSMAVEDLNECTGDEEDQPDSVDSSQDADADGSQTDTDQSDSAENSGDQSASSENNDDPSSEDTEQSSITEDSDTDTGEDGTTDAGNESRPAISVDGNGDGNDNVPFDDSEGRPLMTRAECANAGGTVIGDIGDGAIHKPEYRCESGEPPVARITYLEGETIAAEGEVCCL